MEQAKGDSALQVNCGGQGPLSAEWMIPKVDAIQLLCVEPSYTNVYNPYPGSLAKGDGACDVGRREVHL